MSYKTFWSLIGFAIVSKICLVGWWPFLALTNMSHDATLFLRQAMTLLEGNWLGEYTQTTLMKGPMTPIWIALVNLSGIPLLTANHALYIGACVISIFAFRRLTTSNWYILFVFLLLLFSPYSYMYEPIASGYRAMLHHPIVLGLFAVLIILLLDYSQNRKVSTGYCITCGLLLFVFWNNREEGIWVLPFLLLLVVALVLFSWREIKQLQPIVLTKLFRLVLIPLIIWWTGTYALAWKNYKEYGVFAVVELKTPEFQRAYGGLIGIDAENWHPQIAAKKDVLDKLYSLPSGSELDLDNKTQSGRRNIESMKLPWTFRAAVKNAGYYDKGGASVLAYYDRLGAEIEQACEQQVLSCSEPMFGMLPPFHPEYLNRFFDDFVILLFRIIRIEHYPMIENFYSIGTAKNFFSISRLVNSPIRITETAAVEPPPFYKRITKVKNRYTKKLHKFYRRITPPLFWVAFVGLFIRLSMVISTRRTTPLDVIYSGTAMSFLVLLMFFTLLGITGYTWTTRTFFNIYPVLYIFIGIGLLSFARDTRTLCNLSTDRLKHKRQ